MPQGYKLSLEVDGSPLNFKNVNIREVAGEIESSSKFNFDNSVNLGHTDTDGDLKTLFFSVDEIIKDASIIAQISLYEAGEKYPTSTYSAAYNGTTKYAGTGIYVQELDLNFSIPGEARVRFMFKSVGSFNKL